MSEEASLRGARLTLCRGFYLYTPAPGEVQVRSGLLSGQALAVPDPTRGGLAQVLGRMEGAHTVEQLLRELPEPVRPAVLKVLARLVERGVLVPAEADGSAWIRQGLAPFQGRLAPQRLASAEVALVGAGVLGSRVATNLVLMGVRRLSLWDPTPLIGRERALCPAYLEGEEGAPRAQSLARYLARLEPALSVQPLERPEPVPGSLLVAALDRVEPALLHPLNRAALQSGSPWLLAAMDGSSGLLGPLVVPGQTGCYQCLESSWVARSRRPEQAGPLFEALREHPPAEAAFYGFPAFADTVAGLLAADLPQILTGGAAFTLGQTLVVDFLTLSALSYPVLRLPNCPACGLKGKDAAAT